jgi:tetratricopeptide (TPR) repeat protein
LIVALGAFFLLLQSVSPEAIEHAQAGAAAEQQGRLDVAMDEFRKVIEIQPDLASGYANLGDVYFRKGDYALAIPTLEHALQLNPEMNATQQILGVALLVLGNAAGALPHLEKAPVPELLGLAYLETGQLGNAMTSLGMALARQPDDPDILYYFGHATALGSKYAFERLAKLDPAAAKQATPATDAGNGPIPDLTPLERALLEKPDDPQRLAEFGKTAALASSRALDRIVEGHAGSARAHQVAAERYLDRAQTADAEKEYIQTLRLQPYASGVHLAFGKVLASTGDLPRALAEFRAECGIRPASAEAFYSAGLALLQMGQAKEALATLAHADELGSNIPGILLALGKAAAAAGDAPQAEKVFNKIIDTDKTGDFASQARDALAAMKQQRGKTQ